MFGRGFAEALLAVITDRARRVTKNEMKPAFEVVAQAIEESDRWFKEIERRLDAIEHRMAALEAGEGRPCE